MFTMLLFLLLSSLELGTSSFILPTTENTPTLPSTKNPEDLMNLYRFENSAKVYTPSKKNSKDLMNLYRFENNAKTYTPVKEAIIKSTPTTKNPEELMNLYRFENNAKTYTPIRSKAEEVIHGKTGGGKASQELTVYFRYNDTTEGKELLLVFAEQASEGLQQKSDPKMAKWWATNTNCGMSSSVMGEIRKCVDSTESMLEFVHGVMGSPVKLLSTPPGKLDIYKVVGRVHTIQHQATVCHKQLFGTSYAVYSCHYVPDSQVRLVPLLSSHGKRINALTICHLNTSSWNPHLVMLQLLKATPGPPVCHFLTTDDLVWVPY